MMKRNEIYNNLNLPSVANILKLIYFLINIKAVKNLQNTTNAKTLQDDNVGSMEMHCNPANIIYENTDTQTHTQCGLG